MHRPTLDSICDRFLVESANKPPRIFDVCRFVSAMAEMNHPHPGIVAAAKQRLTSASADMATGMSETVRLTWSLAVLGGLGKAEVAHVYDLLTFIDTSVIHTRGLAALFQAQMMLWADEKEGGEGGVLLPPYVLKVGRNIWKDRTGSESEL